MLFGHDHLDPTSILVDHHLADLGGLQRVDKERRLILVPRDDVDLFTLQLVHHGLHPAAAHAHAGAHRVDRAVIADHRDLGPAARIARHGLDLDDAIVNLRHFHLEQFRHELRIGAAEEYLRPALFAAHVLDIAAHAVIGAIGFAPDLFVAAQDRLAPAHIDDDVAVFLALDLTIDDRADAVLEFLILPVALGLAYLLQDHLLGALRGDPAHFHRRHLFDKGVTHLGIFKILSGLFDRHLGLIILDRVVLDHGAHTGKRGASRLAVDGDADVHLAAVAALGGAGEGFFHRLDHQRGVDHLFTGHRLGGLQQLQLVGGCDCHGLSPPQNRYRSRFQSRQIGLR